MEKLKKFSLLVFVAMLGGLISLGIFKYVDQKRSFPYDNYSNARAAGYEFKNVTVPTFDFADVSEVVMPTVVHITTTMNPNGNASAQGPQRNPFEDLFGDGFGFQMPPQGPQQASGSGVILSSDGYIVTNNHVVQDATEIEVVLYDKRSYKADVIGTDPNTDMALLKINATDLTPVKIGNSDEVRVGEWVLAVGNPFNLTSTVTAGIVSAKGRNIRLLGGGAAIESFIQTDAAVNPGNSGGALINSKGELVGINTAIATHTGQYEGYSFAVPVNIMKKVVDDFKEFGVVQRGFLGVQIQDINSELAAEHGLDRPIGVLVEQLTENGAAEDAGIKKGDVITKVDGRVVNSVSELQEIVGRYRPGQEVKVDILRDKSEKELTVVLLNKDGKTGAVTSATGALKKSLGASFENIKDADRSKLKISNGVKVSSVDKGYFKEADIPAGFIITKVDKVSVYSASDIYKTLDGKKGGILVEGYLPSGDKKYYVLELGK
jgi:Do/DeqQ family serine protease